MLWLLAAFAIAARAPAVAADTATTDLSPGEQVQAARVLEYEGLLGEPVPFDTAMCIDGLLAARWPKVDEPSPRQWQRMLDQARRAREQCAGPTSDTDRGSGVIRRAMALQVARQREMAGQLAQWRACAERSASGPASASTNPAAACQTEQRPGALSLAQWTRIVHALLLGRH